MNMHPTDQQPVVRSTRHILPLDESGRIGPPLLMWFLGVPGSICILAWLFFFRG